MSNFKCVVRHVCQHCLGWHTLGIDQGQKKNNGGDMKKIWKKNLLKSAVVTPFFKKDDWKNLSNCRLITSLPILSKLIEKLFYIRLNNFLYKFNVIKLGKSTEHALIRLLDSLLDCTYHIDFATAVFVDYKYAFDTIKREVLIKNWSLQVLGMKPLTYLKVSYRIRYIRFV